eukprot:4447880-Ditylum_brightwellii.AAC.1
MLGENVVSEVPPFVRQKRAISVMPKALQNGVSTTVSILKRMLHQKKKVAKKYPNMGHQDRLDDLLVVSREKKAIKSRKQSVIFVCHDDFPNNMLYTSE